jgi:Ca2+-binding EF-hand superfamily protein
LDHWGFTVEDKTFKRLFEELDHDKDGKITYADF